MVLCSLRLLAIDAVVSHTIFYKPDQANTGKLMPSLEIYWRVSPNTLHYVTNDDKKIVGNIKTDILLSNEQGLIKEEHYILQTVPVANLGELVQHNIIELKKYSLLAGKIKIRLLLTDMADSVNRYIYRDSFNIPPAPEQTFYSSTELLDTVFETPSQTIFTKNGKQQVPVCVNFIDDGINTLRYYTELYKTDKLDTADFPLTQKVVISKNKNEGYYDNFIFKDTIAKPAAFTAASGVFHISSLPSGNYYVVTTLESKGHEQIASQSYFFQRLNKHPYIDTTHSTTAISDTGIENVTVLNLKKTFVAKYSLAQIRSILKMLLPFCEPMAVQTINGFLKKPDEMYMRYFVYNYFATINKDDPGAAWKTFSKKITEVNKLFNTSSTPGYETDRGYIYLRYGAPTEIVTEENEQGTLPYEVWQYNVLTQLNHKEVPNAFFLFYKPNQMISDYRLLHSTVTGEIQNSQWRNVLYNSQGSGQDYSGNRVEQMLGDK